MSVEYRNAQREDMPRKRLASKPPKCDIVFEAANDYPSMTRSGIDSFDGRLTSVASGSTFV